MKKNRDIREDIISLLKSNISIGSEPPQMVTIALHRALESAPYSHSNAEIMRELRQMELDGFIAQDSTHTVYYEDGITPSEGGFIP